MHCGIRTLLCLSHWGFNLHKRMVASDSDERKKQIQCCVSNCKKKKKKKLMSGLVVIEKLLKMYMRYNKSGKAFVKRNGII